MVTNDDRMKVVRKLREYASWDEDGELVGCTEFGESVLNLLSCGDTERECFNALADLIEPEPERTCRMVSAFDTDELEGIQENISFSPEDTLAYRCEGCGFDFRYERGLYPSYCPNCGARVTEND